MEKLTHAPCRQVRNFSHSPSGLQNMHMKASFAFILIRITFSHNDLQMGENHAMHNQANV